MRKIDEHLMKPHINYNPENSPTMRVDLEKEGELNKMNEYMAKVDKVLNNTVNAKSVLEDSEIEKGCNTCSWTHKNDNCHKTNHNNMNCWTNDLFAANNRTQFQTGAVRDMHQGKGRCDLLPPNALLRLARHFETGSLKYGDRNWELGIPCHSFADSGMRHLLKFMAGDTDEDHLMAAIWNLMCLAETEVLRPEMMDIPSRTKVEKRPIIDERFADDKTRTKKAVNDVLNDQENLKRLKADIGYPIGSVNNEE